MELKGKKTQSDILLYWWHSANVYTYWPVCRKQRLTGGKDKEIIMEHSVNTDTFIMKEIHHTHLSAIKQWDYSWVFDVLKWLLENYLFSRNQIANKLYDDFRRRHLSVTEYSNGAAVSFIRFTTLDGCVISSHFNCLFAIVYFILLYCILFNLKYLYKDIRYFKKDIVFYCLEVQYVAFKVPVDGKYCNIGSSLWY